MSLRITFDLSDKDLKHFRKLMQHARDTAKAKPEDEIIAAARTMMESVRASDASEFVTDRLERMQIMIDMLEDEEWQIPARERGRVVHALTYFAEENDLIPDHIPVLGFLDDAIMIELVVRELKHEIEAYEDFIRFRVEVAGRKAAELSESEQQARIARKRRALHERMRRRSTRSRRSRRGRGGPKISLF